MSLHHSLYVSLSPYHDNVNKYIPQAARQAVSDGAQSQAAWAMAMKRAKQSVVVRENFIESRKKEEKDDEKSVPCVLLYILLQLPFFDDLPWPGRITDDVFPVKRMVKSALGITTLVAIDKVFPFHHCVAHVSGILMRSIVCWNALHRVIKLASYIMIKKSRTRVPNYHYDVIR